MSGRVPFVHATVVRAQFPTSARPGDDAIVLADGSIEGFVGGQCAEGSVRAAALAALRRRREHAAAGAARGRDGVPRVARGECRGEPVPVRWGAGDLPRTVAAAAAAVRGRAPCRSPTRSARWPRRSASRSTRAEPGHRPDGATAVIVSSHGRDEIGARCGPPSTPGSGSSVWSPAARRGEAVLAELGLTDDRACAPAHAGRHRHRRADAPRRSRCRSWPRSCGPSGWRALRRRPPWRIAPVEVVDPICGMTVVVGPETPTVRLDDGDHWFCSRGAATSSRRRPDASACSSLVSSWRRADRVDSAAPSSCCRTPVRRCWTPR